MQTSTVEIALSLQIVSSPKLHRGRPCIAGTGVTVRRVVGWHKQGLSPQEIADEYGHLSLEQVLAALAWYYSHYNEIEADLAAEEAEIEILIKAVPPAAPPPLHPASIVIRLEEV